MSATKNTRAHALDALRGLAVLMMALSDYRPFGVLPKWMYHCQVPPPLHKFDPNIPGITWVDLVFPFFLFSMGAAIPLALANRAKRGEPAWKGYWTAVQRFFLLAAFAVYREHVVPQGEHDFLLPLSAFVLAFAMFGRFPGKWKPWTMRVLHVAGWLGAGILLWHVQFPDGPGFAINSLSALAKLYTLTIAKLDIIILILANVVWLATVVWLLTRNTTLGRLGAMALVLMLLLNNDMAGTWLAWFTKWSPVPGLYDFGIQHYLLIVLPGTIAGDLTLQWLRERQAAEQADAGSPWKLSAFAVVCLLLLVTSVVGLYCRCVGATVLISTVLAVCGLGLLKGMDSADWRYLRALFGWGCWLLVIGFFAESMGGGIKKDPATMSYFFIPTALAMFSLAGLTVVSDILRKQRAVSLLSATGQNPMLAYLAATNLVPPLWGLLGLAGLTATLTRISPWAGATAGVVETICLAVLVSVFTRFRVYFRT